MDQPQTKNPAGNDVLQSDHHVHMSDEEVAKARAHHNKRHTGNSPQSASARPGQDKKKIPVKPR